MSGDRPTENGGENDTPPLPPTPGAGRPLDSPKRRRLPPLLRLAWYRMNQAFRRRISEAGLTPDQFTLLRTLLEHDAKGLTQRELTRSMASDPNTISSLVQRMEAAGMIDRVPHESDRRALRIRILPAGQEAYETMRPVALKLQEEVLGALPVDEQERFLANLEKIALAARDAARNTILMEKNARDRDRARARAEDDADDDGPGEDD